MCRRVLGIHVYHGLLVRRINIYAENRGEGYRRAERRTELGVGRDALCECTGIGSIDADSHLVEP